MSILVIAELRESELKSATFSVIAAAKVLGEVAGCGFDILAAGAGGAAVADQLKGYGAGTVYFSEGAEVADYTAEAHGALAKALVGDKGYKYVMAAATTTGKDLMPRLAGLLDEAMISDVIGCEKGDGGVVYLRPMYAGNAIAKVVLSGNVDLMTVRETAFDPAQDEGSASGVEQFDADLGELKARFIEFRLTKSDRPSLTEASVIISAGRGVKDAEGIALVEKLADQLGAAMGASRAVVDEGLVPNDLQVGQTGKIVAPDLYIACGISGAIQHVAGMKDSKVIVAINKDEEAPIFEVADYGLVADFAKAGAELLEKIK